MIKNRIINICLVVTASLLLFISQTTRSQVTIGSGLPPARGSILDLKENDNLGANSEKGLSFPRVELTDFNQLYPMFSKDDPYYTANKASIDKAHAGLMVYNIYKTQTDPCDFTLSEAKPGLHIWDGEKWVDLKPEDKTNTDKDVIHIAVRNPDVKIFYDERGGKKEPYPCRKFGEAGIWMTTNLRATRLPDDVTSTTLNPFSNNSNWNTIAISAKKKALYYTPYPGTSHGFDDTWLKQNPLTGYLYNYRAIMAASALSTIVAEPNQGICPKGWHVPTLNEWIKLRDAILDPKDVSKYLLPDANNNYPSPHFTGSDPKNDHRFMDAFFLKCTPFAGEEDFTIKGSSKSYADGGFGMINIGTTQIDIKQNAIKRNNHPIVFFDKDTKEEIWSTETGIAKSQRNKVILINSKGYIIAPLAWDKTLWAYPVRCKKDNDEFDFLD